MQATDVLIIGCGPTGATLACLLGICGIKTVVLEKEPKPYPLPRAVHFDDEVMRVFQSVGIADALLEKVRVNPGMQFVDADGQLLLDWPRPTVVSDQGWHPSYRFHQPDVEALLRERLSQLQSVIVLLSAEVVGIRQTEDNCEVSWIDPAATDQTASNQIRAKYVIGCDGANSVVRRSLDIGWFDLGFKERWLVVDILLKKDRPDFGDVTIQHCNPSRPITYVRCPKNRRRWEITVRDDESTATIKSHARIWSLLSKWVTPADAEIERSAVYTFQSTLANRWYQGRCFLAGDAAHLTPPFMGQGMCGGIRDASNLAWKIAHCVQRGHRESLLKSYQTERLPHMKIFIETAMKLGSLINAAGTKEALQSALLNPDGTAKMKSIKPPLGVGLSAGAETHRGMLSSQPMINNKLLDDCVGYASVLLVEADLAQHVSADQAPNQLQIMKSSGDGPISQYLDQLNSRAAVIRPDRYLLGTANSVVELEALLQFRY